MSRLRPFTPQPPHLHPTHPPPTHTPTPPHTNPTSPPPPAATLVDTVGTAALVTVSPKGGVSLSINVNYLSKAPLNGSVLVEAQVGM